MYYKVKPTKTNLHKMVTPLLLTPSYTYIHMHCICACAMPRTKKGEQTAPILKKTIGLCPSRSYYSVQNRIIMTNQTEERAKVVVAAWGTSHLVPELFEEKDE